MNWNMSHCCFDGDESCHLLRQLYLENLFFVGSFYCAVFAINSAHVANHLSNKNSNTNATITTATATATVKIAGHENVKTTKVEGERLKELLGLLQPRSFNFVWLVAVVCIFQQQEL